MSTLVVKNLPDHLHEALKARARSNHRSLNKEVARIIEQAVREDAVQPNESAGVTSGQPMSMSELEAASTDDRYSRLGSLGEVEDLMDALRAERGEFGE